MDRAAGFIGVGNLPESPLLLSVNLAKSFFHGISSRRWRSSTGSDSALDHGRHSYKFASIKQIKPDPSERRCLRALDRLVFQVKIACMIVDCEVSKEVCRTYSIRRAKLRQAPRRNNAQASRHHFRHRTRWHDLPGPVAHST
jgi:hypothetical protein